MLCVKPYRLVFKTRLYLRATFPLIQNDFPSFLFLSFVHNSKILALSGAKKQRESLLLCVLLLLHPSLPKTVGLPLLREIRGAGELSKRHTDFAERSAEKA